MDVVKRATSRDPLRSMTRQQYDEQTAAATKELKRLRKELVVLRQELVQAIDNHALALNHQRGGR
jgi:hypothetical protein